MYLRYTFCFKISFFFEVPKKSAKLHICFPLVTSVIAPVGMETMTEEVGNKQTQPQVPLLSLNVQMTNGWYER